MPTWPLFTNTPPSGSSQRRPDWERWQTTSWPPPPPWRRFLHFGDDDPAEGKTRKQPLEKELEELEEQEESYWTDWEKGLDSPAARSRLQRDRRRGQVFRLPRTTDGELTEQARQVMLAVNAAIHLRRPLLVSGAPGIGKSSLAHAIAVELGLGPVLTWAVTPRSQLQEGGLYLYDAVGRLQDSELFDESGKRRPSPPSSDYISLGPVGTAFLPFRLPRVLLIDELDKGDLQLPNELLNLFEEGSFEIPQLVREARGGTGEPQVVRTADPQGRWPLQAGLVQCREFPIVVLTSNGERDFPPALHRRCLRVEMPRPTAADLEHVVEAQFGAQGAEPMAALRQEIASFLEGEGQLDRATDQLLNAWHLLRDPGTSPSRDAERQQLREILYQLLNA